MTQQAEEWRPVPGWPVYEVSSLGNIRRVIASPTSPVGPIKVSNNCNGYSRFSLAHAGRRKSQLVHILIATVFLGPKPSPDHEVAHGDGNRANNAVSNLRWATRRENAADRDRHGTNFVGEKHPRAKITVEQARQVKELTGMTNRQIAAFTGVGLSSVSMIRTGKHWAKALAA